jgi:hypothetical protein
MSALEDRLRDTLNHRAGQPRPADDLAGAAIRGARSRMRRRLSVGASSIAAFVVAAIAGVSLAAGPSAAPKPVITVGPLPSPFPSLQSTVDTTDPRHGIGLDVLDNSQLFTVEGKRFTLPLTDLAYVYRLPAGWLYGVWGSPGVLLRPDGTSVQLAALRVGTGGSVGPTSPAVSADGLSVAWITGTTLNAATVTQSGLSNVVSSSVPAGGFVLTWIGTRVVIGHYYDGPCCGDKHVEYDVWDPSRGNFVPHWTRDIYPMGGPVPDGVAAFVRVKAPGNATNEACLVRVDGVTSMTPQYPWGCPAGLGWFGSSAMLSPGARYLLDTDQRDRSLVVYSVLDTAPAPVSRCPADTPMAWESDSAFLVFDKRSGQVVRCRVGSNQTEPVGHVDDGWSVIARYGI